MNTDAGRTGSRERKILWYRSFSIAPGETDGLQEIDEFVEEPATSPEDPDSTSPWEAGVLGDNPVFEGFGRSAD